MTGEFVFTVIYHVLILIEHYTFRMLAESEPTLQSLQHVESVLAQCELEGKQTDQSDNPGEPVASTSRGTVSRTKKCESFSFDMNSWSVVVENDSSSDDD